MPTLAESQGSPADAAGATSIPQAKPASPMSPVVAKPTPVAADSQKTDAESPPKPEAGEDKRLIGRVATLSREAREAEKRAAAAEKRAADAQADAETLRALRSSKDARRASKELGITFEEFVDTFASAEGEAKKVDPVAEIQKIRDELAAKDQAALEGKTKAEHAAIVAERDQAIEASAKNLTAQIAAAGERWEVLGRIETAGREAADATIEVIKQAAIDGHSMTAKEVNDAAAAVLDALEDHYGKLGERYRKTGKGKPEAVASDGPGQRRTLAERQSETAPPKTIDPEIAQGGILMRAQAKAQGDNSSEAVRRRVKDALKAAGVTLQR